MLEEDNNNVKDMSYRLLICLSVNNLHLCINRNKLNRTKCRTIPYITDGIIMVTLPVQ